MHDIDQAYDRTYAPFLERVTLKSLRMHRALSRDSQALTATVYLDGVLVGTAENNGGGGETLIDARGPAREAWAEFNAAVRAEGEKHGLNYLGGHDVVDQVAHAVSEDKRHRRRTSTHVVFQGQDGKTYEVKWPQLAKLWRANPADARKRFESAMTDLAVASYINDRYAA
jgi:hypothetical protein